MSSGTFNIYSNLDSKNILSFIVFYVVGMKYILMTLALLMGFNTVAQADFSNCKDSFYNGVAPVINNTKLNTSAYELCYTGFAVLYSGLTKTPIYSAEKLTADNIANGKQFDRTNAFHADTSIPSQYSASLNDYRNSGYDKGHATPFADLGSQASQHDSFVLTNIMPQAPKNNQQAWRLLEETVRNTVSSSHDDAYVITGSIYNSNLIKKVGSVLVPDYIYKVVYYPKSKIEDCYLAQNTNDAHVHKVSTYDLENMTGVKFFSN